MPCIDISVVSKTKFNGEFNAELLQQALATIPDVMSVTRDGTAYQVNMMLGGRLSVGMVEVLGNGDLAITGSGQFILNKRVPQYYNATVQAAILRKMGFNTKLEAKGQNIMVQAVR